MSGLEGEGWVLVGETSDPGPGACPPPVESNEVEMQREGERPCDKDEHVPDPRGNQCSKGEPHEDEEVWEC